MKVWTTEKEIWIETDDGRKAFERFEDYPRLRDATKQEREGYVFDSYGIHWDYLDEDLCYEGFFNKNKPTSLYEFFMAHPEINVSALARRLGMKQSLLASYISGTKKASNQRLQEIEDAIKSIGNEISKVSLVYA